MVVSNSKRAPDDRAAAQYLVPGRVQYILFGVKLEQAQTLHPARRVGIPSAHVHGAGEPGARGDGRLAGRPGGT